MMLFTSQLIYALVTSAYVFLLDMQIFMDARKKDPKVKYDWKKAVVRTSLSLLTTYAASLGVQLPQ